MEFLAKGQSFNFEAKTAQPQGSRKFYVGCAWDGDVDLDLIAVPVRGTDVQQADILYFNNLTSLNGALKHSGDALDGAADGDDESLVFDTSLVPADVTAIVIGVIAYNVPDMSEASNTKFSLRDGDSETAPQMFTLPMSDDDVDGETVLVACKLTREGNEWKATSIGDFRTGAAQGSPAINDLVTAARTA